MRACQYLESLSRVYTEISVADAKGAAVDLDDAVHTLTALIQTRTADGRKVIFVGNGGSAAIASHQAIDYWKNGGLKAIAFNDPAWLTCLANDYGYPAVFAAPIRMFADAGDVVMAISSSGRSVNILNAVRAARERQCSVVTLSGFAPSNDLRSLGDLNFYVPSDSYGFVEIAHLTVLHAILDAIIAERTTQESASAHTTR